MIAFKLKGSDILLGRISLDYYEAQRKSTSVPKCYSLLDYIPVSTNLVTFPCLLDGSQVDLKTISQLERKFFILHSKFSHEYVKCNLPISSPWWEINHVFNPAIYRILEKLNEKTK